MENIEKLKKVWQKARLINKADFENPEVQNSADEFRLDDFGGIMKWDDYGKHTEFGWTLDHVLPVSKGGTDHFVNLQALHWKNNVIKGDTFFGHLVAVGITAGSPYSHATSNSLHYYLSHNALQELATIYPDNIFVNEAIQHHISRPQDFVTI